MGVYIYIYLYGSTWKDFSEFEFYRNLGPEVTCFMVNNSVAFRLRIRTDLMEIMVDRAS